jgi:hypothetical protein
LLPPFNFPYFPCGFVKAGFTEGRMLGYDEQRKYAAGENAWEKGQADGL